MMDSRPTWPLRGAKQVVMMASVITCRRSEDLGSGDGEAGTICKMTRRTERESSHSAKLLG